MEAGISPARQTRTQYRHELRTLTYVTLDQANGGIVRNMTHDGIGVQAVAALRPMQQLRLRFELRAPRLRVETRGEVMWSTPSGQCGIRFLDLPPRISRQLQEWIFGNLLEGISVYPERPESMFAEPALGSPRSYEGIVREDDGLMVSTRPLRVIELPNRPEAAVQDLLDDDVPEISVSLDWLSRPFSEQGLTWAVNTMVLVAGLLLFALVFMSVTREAPPWTFLFAGAFFIVGMYWGFFQMFGGSSLGSRLARLAASDQHDDEEARQARFR